MTNIITTIENFGGFVNTIYEFLVALAITIGILGLFIYVSVRLVRSIYETLFFVKGSFLGPYEMKYYIHASKEKCNKVALFLNEELPKELSLLFTKKGGSLKFCLHREFVKENSTPGSVGCFNFLTGDILIDIERPWAEIKETIYHEFGHFCDWLNCDCWGFESLNNIDILNLYYDNLKNEAIPPYYRSSAGEFMAYCASSFYCKPSAISQEMLDLGERCFKKSFARVDSVLR